MGIDRSNGSCSKVEPISPAPEATFKALSMHEMHVIDEALASIGAFGEVRLVMSRGKLRFINTLRSQDLDRRR